MIDPEGNLELDVVGVRRLGYSEAAAASDQIHIGSGCKMITAALFGTFVSELSTNWDMPVTELFPDLADSITQGWHQRSVAELFYCRAGSQRRQSERHMTLEELKNKYPGAASFKFGDGASLCALLIRLVREGKKTATCGALHDFSDDGEELPVVGRCDIALNWDGTPALVIKTVSVEIKRFCDVDEEFALLEGENDSLLDWRSSHQAYFERNGGFDNEMLLVCERFEVIEDINTSR